MSFLLLVGCCTGCHAASLVCNGQAGFEGDLDRRQRLAVFWRLPAVVADSESEA
jgi:hypothetical protein